MITLIKLIYKFYSFKKRIQDIKRMKSLSKLFKIIFTIFSGLPLFKVIYIISKKPAFLFTKKVLAYLCLILSLITIFTELEPLNDIHHTILAVYGSASILSYAYFDKFYFWLLSFLIKKVDNPDEVIKILEMKFENREKQFKSFGDMIKFLEENPNKRIIWKRESEESSTVKIFHYLKENYNPERPWWDLRRYTEPEPIQVNEDVQIQEPEKGFFDKYKNEIIISVSAIAASILLYWYFKKGGGDDGDEDKNYLSKLKSLVNPLDQAGNSEDQTHKLKDLRDVGVMTDYIVDIPKVDNQASTSL